MKTPAPNKRERDGSQQNNQRIAETVELRCEDEKNQHERQAKTREKLAAFGPQLARLASVVDHITLGQNLVCLILQKLQSGIDRTAGTPLMVTAFSCCIRLSERATVLCLIVATVLSGINLLLGPLT